MATLASGRVTYVCDNDAEFDALVAQAQARAQSDPLKVKIFKATRTTRTLIVDLTQA